MNKIINKNCIEGLAEMPAAFVDLVITSPPYDNLRDYNGIKWDFEVFKQVAVQLKRSLKQGGVIMWNVNDACIGGSETGSSFRQALHFKDIGFRLHDTMIYEKVGASYPAGKTSNRYSQVFEYCFILSLGKPKTANLIADRKNNWAGSSTWGMRSNRQVNGDLKSRGKGKEIPEYGIRNDIWKITNQGGFGNDEDAYAHPATMPQALAEDMIRSWSNKGDLILDPFMGSGTTAIAALKHNRNYLGFEISSEYCSLAEKRLGKQTQALEL